ncbi:unnamed protein product [Parascedosporium putredinis]|uniref:Uncharacterized protein n=1 Tax=Parascedosporium putredinis TaxID=1442378 RepID=A0A9P1M7A0_9PEZI|nr:unnamed protein product [Parascedosporium putredinis]CAI7987971.1 unnamed protein product [Parascedosporium putredinis]
MLSRSPPIKQLSSSEADVGIDADSSHRSTSDNDSKIKDEEAVLQEAMLRDCVKSVTCVLPNVCPDYATKLAWENKYNAQADSLLRAYQVIADQGDAANRSLAPQQNCSLRDQDGFGENFQYALKAAADSDQKYYIALEMQAARRIARFLDRRGRQVGVQLSSSAGADAADVATLECACCYGDEVAERMVSCDGEAGHRKLFLCARTAAALDRLEQQASIRMAGLDNLTSCPFCPYAAEYPPVELDKEFRCENPDCKAAPQVFPATAIDPRAYLGQFGETIGQIPADRQAQIDVFRDAALRYWGAIPDW